MNTNTNPILRKRPLSCATIFAASFLLSSTSILTVQGVQQETAIGQQCSPNLACVHGGQCEEGEPAWLHSLEVSSNKGLPEALANFTRDGFYCKCPSMWAGATCEIPYVQCHYQIGSSTGSAVCYHGGQCLEENPSSWNAHTPTCNCHHAHYEGETYVGRHCELLQSKADPCQGQDSHCLNGGVCRKPKDVTDTYCNCPSGFSGPLCENVDAATSVSSLSTNRKDESDCTLECHHKSTCHFADSQDVSPKWGTLDNMFCECSKEYAGVQCEHIAEVCGDDELVCLHGSRCHPHGNLSSWQCNCPHSQESYAGGVCLRDDGRRDQFRVTMCNPMNASEFSAGMAVPSFCANGGTCKDQVVDGLLISGCDCPMAFTGPHCEFVRSASDGRAEETNKPVSQDSSGKNSRRKTMNAILVVLSLLGGFWLVQYAYRSYQAHRKQNEVVLNLQSFREENQGAVSANGSMLFPSMNVNANSRVGNNQFTLSELMHDVEIS